MGDIVCLFVQNGFEGGRPLLFKLTIPKKKKEKFII